MKNGVNSESAVKYEVGQIKAISTHNQAERDDEVIAEALAILTRRLDRQDILTSPAISREYLSLKYGETEHEIFGIIMCDNRNRVISISEMFRGTVDGASVYPREVVKEVLKQNAVAIVIFHNHPSGVNEPSQADIRITERLKKALELVDVRILDHIIVGGATTTSFAERGLV